jgi:hypothetical protein
MTSVLDVMAVRVAGDPAAAVIECGEPPDGAEELRCDVLVAGGGTGGIAAALAAARAEPAARERDWTVCLVEETAITGAITGIPDSLEAAALPGDVRRRYGL